MNWIHRSGWRRPRFKRWPATLSSIRPLNGGGSLSELRNSVDLASDSGRISPTRCSFFRSSLKRVFCFDREPGKEDEGRMWSSAVVCRTRDFDTDSP
jgi:hypothetical protein